MGTVAQVTAVAASTAECSARLLCFRKDGSAFMNEVSLTTIGAGVLTRGSYCLAMLTDVTKQSHLGASAATIQPTSLRRMQSDSVFQQRQRESTLAAAPVRRVLSEDLSSDDVRQEIAMLGQELDTLVGDLMVEFQLPA